MTVDRQQIKAMGDIMARLNSALEDEPSTAINESEGSVSSAIPVAFGTDEAKVVAMGDIMKRFREATENMREEAQSNEVLMEALTTERTETGVRIAEWEIAIKEVPGRGKFYDVRNTATDSLIASDLRLYEAALILTRELNRGKTINSPTVSKVLRLEEEFSKHLDDALRYAKIAKTATGEKQVIAEARYSDAKSKALTAKEAIKRVG